MLPSENGTLHAQRNTRGSTFIRSPSQGRYLLLAFPPRKYLKLKLTNSIVSRAICQHTNLHVSKEDAISAETCDIRIGASGIGKVVGEAGLCAGWEAGEVLCKDCGSCYREEGEHWELHGEVWVG